MDFRSLTVKELFDNPATAAVIKEDAPQLLKYPIKMFNKKKCGEIFDKVVAAGSLIFIIPLLELAFNTGIITYTYSLWQGKFAI